MKKIKPSIPKPLTHFGKLGNGYHITAFEDRKGDIHLVIGLCGESENGIVYRISSNLQELLPENKYTAADIREAFRNDAFKQDLKWVGDHYRNDSIRSAFDCLAFGDEDPIYKDELYWHLSDMNDFYEFCDECRRRRRDFVGIGIEAIANCGEECRKCSDSEMQMCLTIWAIRNSKFIKEGVEPDFYKDRKEARHDGH